MKGIAILSPKGGVGKSTLCHLLALGAAGWSGIPTYVVHTDKREPMTANGRPYGYIDGRNPEDLATVMGALMNDDGYTIIDGGGNRADFDTWIAESVDLVLIPIVADEESLKLGTDVMKQMQGLNVPCRYILNKVKANRHERAFDFTHFYNYLESDLIVGELKDVSAVKRLRMSDKESPFPTPPSNVNNLSRHFYSLINEYFQTRLDTIEAV